MNEIRLKEEMELLRMQKNNKKVKVEGLIDASSKNRNQCELFIFEGESASNGRRFRDPQTQAFFMLRGKFLNVLDIDKKKILENKEAAGLINAIGLTLGDNNLKGVRYNKIIICSDADTDGDSIASQLLNFFHLWPSLFEGGLVYRSMTPLLILRKAKVEKYMYSLDEIEEWEKTNDKKGWEYDYKKGLGSLEDKEYEKILKDPKLIRFVKDENAEEKLNIWFGKNSELRKKELL